MQLLIGLLTFVLIAYYVRIRRRPTWQQGIAYVLLIGGILACVTGFSLAVQEDARSRYGRVAQGVVVDRMSSTGEQGTPTFGPSRELRGRTGYDPLRTVNTREGYEFYDVFARQVLSGSSSLWVIDYGYDCGRRHPCWGRDFVAHDRWLQLDVGTRVPVRYVADGIGGARLEGNAQWATAIVEMSLGLPLLIGAVVLVRGLPSFGRRVHRLQTTAVVTAVEQVQHVAGLKWRVRFTYLDDLGGQREATDQFAVDEWKVGDLGVAVYEVADPNMASLRREE